MKALQPLNFLICHLRPSCSRPSLHLHYHFYCAHVAQLSLTQSNRSLHLPQTRYNSTTTSSKEAFQSNTSSQNADDTSTSKVYKAFSAVKPEDDSSFSSHEALDSSDPTSLPPEGDPAHQEPGYHLSFTCKPCEFRSVHSISKQGYHNGTVLITCPNCKNRHVISDHLKIFSDLSITIEDILRQKGETLKRGRINPKGDVEFFPDPGEVPHVTTLTEEQKIARLMKEFKTPRKSE